MLAHVSVPTHSQEQQGHSGVRPITETSLATHPSSLSHSEGAPATVTPANTQSQESKTPQGPVGTEWVFHVCHGLLTLKREVLFLACRTFPFG